MGLCCLRRTASRSGWRASRNSKPLAEARNDGIVIEREGGFGEDAIERGQRFDAGGDFGCVGAQRFGDFGEDALDFAQLVFAQADELVVEVDGFERLEKERAAGAARAVNDAVDAAFLSGDDGHDVAVFADGDEVFLERAIGAMRAQESFERFLDAFLLAFDVAADAAESDAGVIGKRAVGKKDPCIAACQIAEIG